MKKIYHAVLQFLLICGLCFSLPIAQAATYSKTKYPVVLVHGIFGFDSIVGVDYFYQIPDALRESGSKVYIARVSQLGSSAARGEQLLQQMKEWAAIDQVEKFNLIAHSQGGLDARYVGGVAPNMVASITTVGSPTLLKNDLAANATIGALLSDYGSLATLAAKSIAWLSGASNLPQNVESAQGFSDEINDFATRFPAGVPSTYCGEGDAFANGMYLFSATGNQPKTNAWDISDSALVELSEPSDGAVEVCSAHFGKVIRDTYPWNHFDEMNHVFGLVGSNAPSPVRFYVQHANRLKGLGL